jgi:serine/threonine-protein kinase HipA
MGDFHAPCSQRFFGSVQPPLLPYSTSDLHQLASQIVAQSIAVTGVQPKLSLAFERNVQQGVYRLTLVGLWGNFILKPPNPQYPELVENEHATMRLAQVFGIETVPFSLIRLQSGEPAFLTRRIDRLPKNGKLHMEDFCQITGRLTEYKYRGSMEQVAKVVRRFSADPGFDVLRLLELALFCFLTGNADMHLKNFSMITHPGGEVRLAPAYDLVATKLAMPQDPEESALTINGKKSNLKPADFLALAETSAIPPKAAANVLNRFFKKIPGALASLETSLLSRNLQARYAEMLKERAGRIWGQV